MKCSVVIMVAGPSKLDSTINYAFTVIPPGT